MELTVSVLSGDIEAGVSVVVTVMTVDGSAVAGEDYTELTRTLTFTSSEREFPVSVDILDDTIAEGEENFIVSLSGDRVFSGSSVATVTIIDDDVEIGFSPDEYIVDEDAGSITLTVSVLVGTIEVGESVTLSVRTIDESAVAGEDYSEVIRTLTFSADTQTVTLAVTILDDELVEGSENFIVELSSMSSDVVVSAPRATVMIQDSDSGEITVSAVSPSVTEGDVAMFRVELTGGVTAVANIGVTWNVDCDAGSEVTAEDFVGECPSSTVSTVTIQAGSSSADFPIMTFNDNVVEGMEEFTVMLTNVLPNLGGLITISDSMSTASVTIADGDRGVVSVTVGTSTIPEGGEVTFTVELGDDVIADEAIGVEWSVSCDAGNGITAGDFVGDCPAGTVDIVSGETSATFTVSTADDDEFESDEEFTVTLTLLTVSPTIEDRVTISSTMSSASVTIMDNDEAPPVAIGFSPAVYSVDEDDGIVTLTVLVSGEIEAGVNVTVTVMTMDGSAVASGDYSGLTQTLMFSSDVRTQMVAVTIASDTLIEGTENFIVELSSMSSDVVVSAPRATVMIQDSDSGEITVSAVSPSVTEGSTAVFTVELTGGVTVDENIGVTWSVDCATAMTGVVSSMDFVGGCPSDTVTIAVGSSSADFPIMTLDDNNMLEYREKLTVTVTLKNVSPDIKGRITIADTMSRASVTILDDESSPLGVRYVPEGSSSRAIGSGDPPRLRQTEEGTEEGDAATFRVSFLNNEVTADENIGVTWSVNCGAGSEVTVEDFVGGCPSGTVTIPVGSRFADFSIVSNDDSVVEGTEELTVMLTSVSPDIEGRITISDDTGDTGGMSVATVTIEDNDSLRLDLLATADQQLVGLSYSVVESPTTVRLTVGIMTGAIAEGVVVTVSVMTMDGTAVAGEDYTATTATLTFTSSMTEATVTVDIIDDNARANDESFLVVFSGERVLPLTATVTITDDDPLDIGFERLSYDAQEGGSVMLTVSVLSGSIEAGSSVTVVVMTMDGTAVAPGDYTAYY